MVAYLLKLMARPQMPKGARVGPEARECILFADMCREMTLTGRLNAVWFHIPNEGKRSRIQGALLKIMGLIPGAPDFMFSGNGVTGFLEFKAVRGKQTENQEAFQRWCAQTHARYAVVYTADDAIDTLRQWGIIL